MISNLIAFPPLKQTKSRRPKPLKPQFEHFQVNGDRLEYIGVLNGDTILVGMYEAIANGDLTLVQTPDERTVLLAYFLGNGKIALKRYPDDPKPFVYKLSEVKLEGRVLFSHRTW